MVECSVRLTHDSNDFIQAETSNYHGPNCELAPGQAKWLWYFINVRIWKFRELS